MWISFRDKRRNLRKEERRKAREEPTAKPAKVSALVVVPSLIPDLASPAPSLRLERVTRLRVRIIDSPVLSEPFQLVLQSGPEVRDGRSGRERLDGRQGRHLPSISCHA
jgi:hypothetical protein